MKTFVIVVVLVLESFDLGMLVPKIFVLAAVVEAKVCLY